MMDQAITRAAGATPSTTLPAAAAPRLVGEFEGYVDGEPLVSWADRKNMPQVGDKLFAVPRAAVAAGRPPRSWSILLTSENHGIVGPVGHSFRHAGEKHERIQVVEIVAAGAPPAPGVDLAGLVRIDAAELIGQLDEVYAWARELPIPTRGTVSAMQKVRAVKESLAAPSAPVGASVDIPATELSALELLDRALRAARAWANEEYVCARDLGKGGPGTHAACDKREAECKAAIYALAADAARQVQAARDAALEEGAAICEQQEGLSRSELAIAKGCAMAVRYIKRNPAISHSGEGAAPADYKPVGKFLYVGACYEATSSDDPRGITLYRPAAEKDGAV